MFLNSTLAGGFGGIMGQLICSPLFLVKTHLQAEATTTIAVGHQHHHKGMMNALKTIYSKHGVKKMYFSIRIFKCLLRFKFYYVVRIFLDEVGAH